MLVLRKYTRVTHRKPQRLRKAMPPANTRRSWMVHTLMHFSRFHDNATMPVLLLLCLSLVGVVPIAAHASAHEDARAGLEAVRAGDHERGVELLTKAIEAGDLADTNLTIAYYNRGNAWFHLGDYTRALEDLTTAIDRNPRFLEAFIKRGAAYKELGEYELAIADLSSALELNPNNGRALFMRGLAWSLAGDAEAAMRDMSAAHRIDQRFLVTPLLEAVRAAGEEFAIKFTTRAIDSGELGPENLALVHFHRGLAWRDIGANENAAADFTRAVELDPKMTEAYVRRADIAMNNGLHREAVHDYTEALAVDPTMAEAYLRRGVAWARLGDRTQAVRDLAAARELDDSLIIPDVESITGNAPSGEEAANTDASGGASLESP